MAALGAMGINVTPRLASTGRPSAHPIRLKRPIIAEKRPPAATARRYFAPEPFGRFALEVLSFALFLYNGRIVPSCSTCVVRTRGSLRLRAAQEPALPLRTGSIRVIGRKVKIPYQDFTVYCQQRAVLSGVGRFHGGKFRCSLKAYMASC